MAADSAIIPAAGSGPGANGSQWKTEVKIHATGLRSILVGLRFHQGSNVFTNPNGVNDRFALNVPPGTTVTLDDIVATHFGATGTGAIEITTDGERNFRQLAVTSRTYNTLPNGDQVGQDVPAIPLEDAATVGDFVILTGPSNAARQRLNFGIYAVAPTRVTWDLLRSDGRAVTSKVLTYAAGQHMQYNRGIETLFGQLAEDSDTVRAVIDSGKAIVYGSSVDESGDPTYIPGFRTREQSDLIFLGVDTDEDGSIDLPDLNGDNVLDRPLEIVTSLFPATVRVVIRSEFGNTLGGSLTLISSTSDAEFVDRDGTLMIGATGDLKGKTGEIRIQGRDDSSTEVFVIPVVFR
jgi:hypothetical protein